MTETPDMRALRARMAAHIKWSQVSDRQAATAPARQAARDRFEKQVDPDGTMDPTERAQRAEHARKAFYLRMAYLSAQARRERGTGRGRRATG